VTSQAEVSGKSARETSPHLSLHPRLCAQCTGEVEGMSFEASRVREPASASRGWRAKSSPQDEISYNRPMPELPEVETIARGVNLRVRGDRIVEVWFGGKREPSKRQRRARPRAEGRSILEVHRTESI